MSLRLVVGLGNDEKKYALTPHNIGFQALDVLARRWKSAWEDEKGRVWAARHGDLRLIKPCSLMNVSGEKVRWASAWWHVPPTELLVVCDDFALPWGKLRFRRHGSSGGHNGLESLLVAFGTQDIPRLRVGVGPVPEGMDPKDYVLKKHSAEIVQELAERTADAVQAAFQDGLDTAMNRFNGQPG
jgi:PTH1 family peptidyl-tRNA hydrolase